MKNIFILTIILLPFCGFAQNTNVTYAASDLALANPERGFYKHTETHSSGYSALSQSMLTGYRTNSNIDLILRVFYLEDFVYGAISSTYLAAMQSDFVKVRNAGLKCIVRFAYADTNDSGVPHDASKSQILAHIAQLQPILAANSDVIPLLQAGFIGSWGEWYYTDHFGMSPTAADYANRKEVVNALLNAVPGKMVQIRTPSLKQNTYNTTTALSLTQAFGNTTVARLGHHNDCFLASGSDYGTYTNISLEYPYLEQETKFVPMGGETCAINAPRSECTTAVTEMAKFHWSFLNLDYHPGVISGFATNSCFTAIENRLGYRFELLTGTFPQSIALGQPMPISIKIKNAGFATPYNQRTAYVVLRNTVTDAEYSVALTSDPRFWTAGANVDVIQSITLPAGLSVGSYKLFLHMPDANPSIASRTEYAIRFANSNLWDEVKGYNDLKHTVNITSTSLGIGDNNDSSSGLSLYPVPANDELVLHLNGIEDYKVTMYNALGQNVGIQAGSVTSNAMTLNTQSLSNGVYFVTVDNNVQQETKRIIVKH